MTSSGWVECAAPLQGNEFEDADDNDKPLIHVKTDTDFFVLKGRPCELSAMSFMPTQRTTAPEMTYFNSRPEENRTGKSSYDRMFHVEYGYEQKLHRDDRAFAKLRGLKSQDEEKKKKVTTLGNGEYGHRLHHCLDPSAADRQHARVQLINSDFYRNNGINEKPPQSYKDY